MAHVLPTLAAFALPPLPPSLLVSLKKPARGWLHISHAKTFIHTSAPSLINHQAWRLGSGNTGELYFYQHRPQTAPGAPPFLTVTPAGTSFGPKQSLSALDPFLRFRKMVTDPGLVLPSIPVSQHRPPPGLEEFLQQQRSPRRPRPPASLSPKQTARGAGGHR